MRNRRNSAFTLVELLVTVAIVAVIGAGVAAYYGREVVDGARRQLTLHEMGQIRDAFQRFYADNAGQLLDGLTVADSATTLPDAFASASRFVAPDAQTYSVPSADDPQRLYGMFEFFERYGLWPLFQPSVDDLTGGERNVQLFQTTDASGKYAFKSPSVTSGEGWRGPYLMTAERVDCIPHAADAYLLEATVVKATGRKRLSNGANVADSEVRFPQPATKYNDHNGGFYRVIYFEHCPDDSAGQPIYRRLLLMAAETPTACDTEAEIARFRGNRRYGGSDAAPPLDAATGAITAYDAAHRVFFLELLNFDTVYR
ncbi:MAG: type II secretion system protein [Kiritimatiellia bacterium]